MASTATPPAYAYVVTAAKAPAIDRSALWIYAFLAVQVLCQLALLPSAAAPLRPLLRMANFGASVALLLVPGAGRRHPATIPAAVALGILIVSLLHPMTNTLAAGLAQVAMYTAVLAPVFWVPRLAVSSRRLRGALLILWAFHTASAATGVLQVAFPGRFQPSLSSMVAARGSGYVDSLAIRTASGERVFRPMGLTDSPGGASVSGLYAVLLGLGLFLTESRSIRKAAYLASAAAGFVCLYLSQVRSLLAMCVIGVLGICALLLWRSDLRRFASLAAVGAVVLVTGFALAFALGGDTVTQRLSTLTEGSPDNVYYSNRGRFLDETLNVYLPQYPLGAGLGRWGMMNQYFGDNTLENPIWVEIQWTGWLLDGGVPLIAAYLAALAAACTTAWKIATSRDRAGVWIWGAVLAGYNLGAIALTFNYPLFIGQMGMEFWLLNALVFAAARNGRLVLGHGEVS